MSQVSPGEYFVWNCEEFDKILASRLHNITIVTPGCGDRRRRTRDCLSEFSSLFLCEAPVYCTQWGQPIRGPAVPDIDQSEARVSGSFPNSVCVLSRQTARGQKKHRQSIINIRLSPKYFCERFSDLVIFRLRSIRRIMLRGPWMPSWSGLRRAAGKSSQRTRTLTTPRYQRWIKYFTGIFSLFPSFLIIPSPQMENQGIILYLNWSKNISSSLGSNSAPSNPRCGL